MTQHSIAEDQKRCAKLKSHTQQEANMQLPASFFLQAGLEY
jgi:hypothetical protein